MSSLPHDHGGLLWSQNYPDAKPWAGADTLSIVRATHPRRCDGPARNSGDVPVEAGGRATSSWARHRILRVSTPVGVEDREGGVDDRVALQPHSSLAATDAAMPARRRTHPRLAGGWPRRFSARITPVRGGLK